VWCQEARAAQIGVAVLEQGGNAVDARSPPVRHGVTYPRAGNLGAADTC